MADDPKLNEGAGIAAELPKEELVPPNEGVVFAGALLPNVKGLLSGALGVPPKLKVGAGVVAAVFPPKLKPVDVVCGCDENLKPVLAG